MFLVGVSPVVHLVSVLTDPGLDRFNDIRGLKAFAKLFKEPQPVKVLDFIKFLENKTRTKISETAVLSEASLAKDWLKPEEDEAWQNL